MSLSTPEKTGKLIAYALLTGASVQDACRFGAEAQRLDSALSRLAYQIFVAMDFMAADYAAAGDEGHPVRTLSDTFRQMSKTNTNALTATHIIQRN